LTGQELDRYRDKFEDPEYAARYASASSGKTLTLPPPGLGGVIGRLVSILESRAVGRLLLLVPPGGVLLDAPCGFGKLSNVGRSRFRTLGVDASLPLLLMYRSRESAEGVRADLRSLPLRDQSVKSIVCHRFLHRASPQLRSQILEELRRVASEYLIVYYSIPSRVHRIVTAMEKSVLRRERGRIYTTDVPRAGAELEMGPWRIVKRGSVARWISTGQLFLLARDG